MAMSRCQTIIKEAKKIQRQPRSNAKTKWSKQDKWIKQWQENNPKKWKNIQENYYDTHRKKILAYHKKWYKEQGKKYYRANVIVRQASICIWKAKHPNYHKNYYKKNKKHLLKLQRKWRKNNA